MCIVCFPVSDRVFILFRMFKEWSRVFPENWRNIWKRSVCTFSLTTNLSGVWYFDTDLLFLCRLNDQHVAVYFFFFSDSESDGLKTTKLSHLSSLLDQEKKRTESLKEICKENIVLLQRQTQLYLYVGHVFYFGWKWAGTFVVVFAITLQVFFYCNTSLILHHWHIYPASICV